MTSHILTNFQKSLESLNGNVIAMANLAQQNLAAARQGLFNREEPILTEAIADDDDVDQLEVTIDRQGVETIMLFQPVAHDLRQVMSLMKVSQNLERVSDEASNIAKRARKLLKGEELPEVRLLEESFELAISQLKDAINAFLDGDAKTAMEIIPRDKAVNKSVKAVAKQVLARMEENPTRVKDYMNIIIISRSIERVGDHAKNISEDAVFTEKAVDIRHQDKLEE